MVVMMKHSNLLMKMLMFKIKEPFEEEDTIEAITTLIGKYHIRDFPKKKLSTSHLSKRT